MNVGWIDHRNPLNRDFRDGIDEDQQMAWALQQSMGYSDEVHHFNGFQDEIGNIAQDFELDDDLNRALRLSAEEQKREAKKNEEKERRRREEEEAKKKREKEDRNGSNWRGDGVGDGFAYDQMDFVGDERDFMDLGGEDELERALQESLRAQQEQDDLQKAILQSKETEKKRWSPLSLFRRDKESKVTPINPKIENSKDPRDVGRKLNIEKREKESEDFKKRYLEKKAEEERKKLEKMKKDYLPLRENEKRLNGSQNGMTNDQKDLEKQYVLDRMAEENETNIKRAKEEKERKDAEERERRQMEAQARIYEENQRRLEEERRKLAEQKRREQDAGSLIEARIEELMRNQREQEEINRVMRENEERDERELLRIKQLSEFEEAEKEDRRREEEAIKEQQRQKEEEERKKKEEELQQELEKEEGVRKEKRLKELQSKFSDPEPKNGPNITSIAIRMPEGNRIMRNFDSDLPLSYLIDFVVFSSMSSGDNSLFECPFKLVKSAPREELEGDAKSLRELGLAPLSRNMVIVEKCE